ncbi:MAG: hypothetical protein ACOCVA_06830 [Prolixibacteraceae bacterium]
MKKLSIVSVVVICLVVASSSAFATGLNTDFRKYEIEEVDNHYLDKKVEKAWSLSYNSGEQPITVVKRSTLDGDTYVVHAKHFDVCYRNFSSGFGAKQARNSWCSVPKQITNAVINSEQLKRQQILTPEKVSDQQALGLIASYLPDLLNDNYKHVLN